MAIILGDNFDNVLFGTSNEDFIYGYGGDDTIDGGDAADRIFGGSGQDLILGGDGNDHLYGGSGSDRIFGGDRSDVIYGDVGTDTLFGGSGNDSLFGGEGGDRIAGGTGADEIMGGSGPDTFVYKRVADSPFDETYSRVDRIGDWDSTDTINLSKIDANSTVDGNQAFTFAGYWFGTPVGDLATGELAITGVGSELYIVANTDADPELDFCISLWSSEGEAGLTVSDLVL